MPRCLDSPSAEAPAQYEDELCGPEIENVLAPRPVGIQGIARNIPDPVICEQDPKDPFDQPLVSIIHNLQVRRQKGPTRKCASAGGSDRVRTAFITLYARLVRHLRSVVELLADSLELL